MSEYGCDVKPHGELAAGRISIARRLYKEMDLLILDEATSALDSETDLFIQKNIERLQGIYRMVIIAHRLRTVKHAGSILVTDKGNKGKVDAIGTFDQMMESSPRFRKMVDLQ